MRNYDKIFNKEIDRVLKEIYNNSLNMGETKLKRALVSTEKRYVDYLEEINLIKRVTAGDGNGKWGMQLERKGFEVFEKYDGWFDYKKQIINKQDKIEKSKALAQKYWWLPILISLLALGVAAFALFTKN